MSHTHRSSPSARHEPNLWPCAGGREYLSSKGLALLEQIELTGSISRAAKHFKMSYKAAWDAVDALNNLSERPLVICSAGHSEGGGTRLSDFGRDTVYAWRRMQAEHERCMARVAQGVERFEDVNRLLRAVSVQTSAGNQFQGRVKTLEYGSINTNVTVDLGSGLEVVASVSTDCVDEMQLSPGRDAMALIKPSFVLLSLETNLRVSARNRLHGKLVSIIPGPINSEVKLHLPGERTLTATVTNEGIAEMGLAPGQPCTALVKASHVIIIAV